MKNRAHLCAVFGLDGVGVIPEIEAVDAFVVEPQAGVVGVVDALAGAGRERVAARDGDAFVGNERIENGLFERSGPDVRGEGLAVDSDVNATVGFIGDDLDAFGGGGEGAGRKDDACGEKSERHGLAHSKCPL